MTDPLDLDALQPCEECGGSGTVIDAPGNVLDGPFYMEQCEACDGTGVRKESYEIGRRRDGLSAS